MRTRTFVSILIAVALVVLATIAMHTRGGGETMRSLGNALHGGQ